VADQRRVGVEERKGVCAKGCGAKSGDNLVAPRHAGSRTWRPMKNGGVGY